MSLIAQMEKWIKLGHSIDFGTSCKWHFFLNVHLDKTAEYLLMTLMYSHPARPYVELINFLLKCSDEVRMWVGRRLREQCEHYWGSLCSSFAGSCPLCQSDTLNQSTSPSTSAQLPITAKPEDGPRLSHIDDTTEPDSVVSEKSSVTLPQTDGNWVHNSIILAVVAKSIQCSNAS